MNQFKTMLRYLRKKKNISQVKLSENLGVSKSTISMYEAGKRQPDFETLNLIAEYFNVSTDYLLGKVSIENTSLFDEDFEIKNLEQQEEAFEYHIEQIENENARRENYFMHRKEELKENLDKSYRLIHMMIDTINLETYEKSCIYEKYLETLFMLLLKKEYSNIFKTLFQYPLHMIDINDLKDIENYIDRKLKYKYHIHYATATSKTPFSIDEMLEDLLNDYTYMKCVHKDELWGEPNAMDNTNDFEE